MKFIAFYCFTRPAAFLLAVATIFAIGPAHAAEMFSSPRITYRIKDTSPPPANEADGKWPSDPELAWRAVERAASKLERDIAYEEKQLREMIAEGKKQSGWNDALAATPKPPAKQVITVGSDADLAKAKRHCDRLERYLEVVRLQSRTISSGYYAKPNARTFRTAPELIKAMTFTEGNQTRTDDDRVANEIVEVTLTAQGVDFGNVGFTSFGVTFMNLREVGSTIPGKGIKMTRFHVNCYPDEFAEAQRRLEAKVVTMKITGVIVSATTKLEEVDLVLSDARIEVLEVEDFRKATPTVLPDLTKAAPERKPFDGKSIDKLPVAEQMTELMRESNKLRRESKTLRDILEGDMSEAARMKGIDAALLKPPKEPGNWPKGAISGKDVAAMKKTVNEWIAYRDGLHTQVRGLKAAMAKVYEGKK